MRLSPPIALTVVHPLGLIRSMVLPPYLLAAIIISCLYSPPCSPLTAEPHLPMHIYPVALAGACLLTSTRAVDFTSLAIDPVLAAASHIPGAPFLLDAVAPTRTSTVTRTATASRPPSSSTTSSSARQSQSPAPAKHKTYTPVTSTLADGSSPRSGSLNSTLRWQSSGVLQHGTLL